MPVDFFEEVGVLFHLVRQRVLSLTKPCVCQPVLTMASATPPLTSDEGIRHDVPARTRVQLVR